MQKVDVTWAVPSETAIKKGLTSEDPSYYHFVNATLVYDHPIFNCTCRGYEYKRHCAHIKRVQEIYYDLNHLKESKGKTVYLPEVNHDNAEV